MRRNLLVLAVMAVASLFFNSQSFAVCPQDPIDLGTCDTLYVETFDGDYSYGATAGYDSVRVAIYVTHDSNTFWWAGASQWVQDSITAFFIPLKWWKEGCADSVVLPTYNSWNNKATNRGLTTFKRSIFRDLLNTHTGVTDSNRYTYMMYDLGYEDPWSVNVNFKKPDSAMICMMAPAYGKWWEGKKALLATLTFLVYQNESCDSTGICLDSTFWPPGTNLAFCRYDAVNYVPRHFLPVTNIVTRGLVASFSAEPDSGFAPLTVHFTDLSTGDPTTWLWNFGDNHTSTEQNPVHVYNSTGSYYPKLIVSNEYGADTLISPNPIVVWDTLTVDFTAQPTQGRKPLNVSFHSIFNHTPANVKWYFGDGQTSSNLNPVHQYTEFGNYDVILVGELFGYRDSLTKEDYVRVSDIKAGFGADKRCGSAPFTVAFSDSSTSSYPITNWHWDFDDGGTSNLQNPTHQFQGTGVFDITLIVSDGIAADTLKKQGYITTQDSVSADFIGLPTSGRSPLTVMFEPILEGIANHYFWDFGDGDTSVLRNPIHIYTNQGKYDVKLRVRLELDDCDQVDSMTKEDYVIVNDLEAKFSANPTAGVAPLLVQFTDSSSGSPDTWFWDFGDGNTSAQQHPQHQYDTAGIYDVFLRVSNFISVDSLLKLDYILVTDTLYADLSAEIYGPGGARPGFNIWFYFAWTNIGTIPAQNCTLKILLPPEMTFYNVYVGDIRTGTYSGYSFSEDTIIVPLQSINPSNWYGGYVYVYGNLPASVPIGDTLICKMWLTSSTPEWNYDNNYVLFRQVVTGSIDPNDKLASPEGEGTSHAITLDQRLAYTIQFENKAEATAEAIYIRVADTLDQDLDWGTLAVGAMSNPDECDYEFDPYTGVIVWFCDSIMLPPNQNPPEGEGYFTYSISPKSDLKEGTEIANSAWIRFDYNEWLHAPEEGPVIRTIKYPFIYGDANKDGKINSADVAYLINYLFIGGPAPQPWQAGDANCDGNINSADVAYIINYLFVGGPAPGC